jgi:hypothetical protein
MAKGMRGAMAALWVAGDGDLDFMGQVFVWVELLILSFIGLQEKNRLLYAALLTAQKINALWHPDGQEGMVS